ncbi:hypothetical protein [Bacillus taeanensis]|uniref:Uncharacterized protein n=1 Tax=Bacillus taeanensis TaxID=273032 RepID=A0A366XS26_9BACI|nr:hypothetical protein [Bacillus taeanensis]RBW69180.1 hypothetical protein DS031_12395 [Bacillus taeanensis]
MRNAPNFSEFYQKPLILIGENDRLSVLNKTLNAETLPPFTHWLIAVEGSEINPKTKAFQWSVVVFPANIDGGFNYKFPYYISAFFLSITEAIKYTKEIEQLALQDQLFTVAN